MHRIKETLTLTLCTSAVLWRHISWIVKGDPIERDGLAVAEFYYLENRIEENTRKNWSL
jgi:hypothetical protein